MIKVLSLQNSVKWTFFNAGSALRALFLIYDMRIFLFPGDRFIRTVPSADTASCTFLLVDHINEESPALLCRASAFSDVFLILLAKITHR